jgi:U6 snRNA-associated Sm-like protein LSm1
MDGEDSSYLPGAAALIDQLDTSILVILKDGRNLVGTLRSFDQYMNLVLEATSERISTKGTSPVYFKFVIDNVN